MADRVVELVLNLVLWTVQCATIAYDARDRARSQQQSSNNSRFTTSISQLSQITPYPRAVLLAASSISFGNDCERFVNIAFQTCQTFPTTMSTYGNVNEYLNNELKKNYADQCFHIIIGENRGFGFSVGDDEYFAEIEQDRYRVVIFATKKHLNTQLRVHDTNSEMIFKWK